MTLLAIILAGSSSVVAPTWLSEAALLSYLEGSRDVTLPLEEISGPKPLDEICVMAGIYSREVPAHLPGVESQLINAGLLPVAEGSGLVFSVSNGELVEAALFDAWGKSPVLELPDDATCYPVRGGTLRVWRYGSDGIRLTFADE